MSRRFSGKRIVIIGSLIMTFNMVKLFYVHRIAFYQEVKHDWKDENICSPRGMYMRTVRISSQFRCISDLFRHE